MQNSNMTQGMQMPCVRTSQTALQPTQNSVGCLGCIRRLAEAASKSLITHLQQLLTFSSQPGITLTLCQQQSGLLCVLVLRLVKLAWHKQHLKKVVVCWR